MATSDRASPESASNARRAWTRMVHLFIAENHRRGEIADDLDMTVADLITLFRLQPGSALPQRDLAHQWACDASWVTAKVDQLESLGLVERRPNPSDRRSKTVALTADGERTRDRALDRFYDPPAAFAALSDSDVQKLADILGRLPVPDQLSGAWPGSNGWVNRKLDQAEAKAHQKIAQAEAKAHQKIAKARRKLA